MTASSRDALSTEDLSTEERRVLAALAEVIVPAYGRMPSAGAIDLCHAPIDRVLAVRPDLAAPLRRLLADATGWEPRAWIEALERDDPPALRRLLEAVAGAYYMDARVRALLGYRHRRIAPVE